MDVILWELLSVMREDAFRRDFTINGLFFDPVKRVVDGLLGRQQDLEKGIIRAIGDPDMRFGEDHLRMLRAVRFSANMGFIRITNSEYIERLSKQLELVSPERLAAELRLMVLRGAARRCSFWQPRV